MLTFLCCWWLVAYVLVPKDVICDPGRLGNLTGIMIGALWGTAGQLLVPQALWQRCDVLECLRGHSQHRTRVKGVEQGCVNRRREWHRNLARETVLHFSPRPPPPSASFRPLPQPISTSPHHIPPTLAFFCPSMKFIRSSHAICRHHKAKDANPPTHCTPSRSTPHRRRDA